MLEDAEKLAAKLTEACDDLNTQDRNTRRRLALNLLTLRDRINDRVRYGDRMQARFFRDRLRELIAEAKKLVGDA
jgi:hypothetical protein